MHEKPLTFQFKILNVLYFLRFAAGFAGTIYDFILLSIYLVRFLFFQPQYWGLSKEEEGCQPCGCDPGGSYDNDCDVITGACNCKPGIKGRACDMAIPGYFIPDLDFLRYEGELATGTGVSHKETSHDHT